MSDRRKGDGERREAGARPTTGSTAGNRRWLTGLLRRRVGVTLMELLIVLLILGVLVAIGVPNYSKALERAYFREAEDLLLTIYSGQRAYFFMTDAYLDPPNNGNTWRDIHMDDPNLNASLPVDFTIVTANCADPGPPPVGCREFTAKAKRSATTWRTLNEQRVWTESAPPWSP